MMKKQLFPILSLFSMLCFSSCYYDKASVIYPSTASCDTASVKYSTFISPTLNTYCNGCHGGSAAMGAGIVLDNYTSVKTYVTSTKLLSSIQQNGTASAMPKGGSKLDACTINKFDAWIKNGAPNN